LNEVHLLRNRVQQLEEVIKSNQKASETINIAKELQSPIHKKIETQINKTIENRLQKEIQKRLEIEEKFSREADEIQAKVTMLEEQLKLKILAESILARILASGEIDSIDNDTKKVIRQAYGENIYKLLIMYEKRIHQHLKNAKISSLNLENLLNLALSSEDKARTLRFINESDYESAACILKNTKNSLKAPPLVSGRIQDSYKSPGSKSPGRLSPKASQISPREKTSPRTSDLEKSSESFFISYMQVQASVVEELLTSGS
jgi:hypothetical protein